jgi:tRNA 2-thiouridine synthesizing protein A
MVVPPIDLTLDCTGLYCPEPVIRTAARVREMSPGQVLQVIGDDPGLQIDIPAWCLSHGHEYLGLEIRANLLICTLRVAG